MMAVVAQPSITLVERAALPDAYAEPHWYAAYTRANHERRVAEQLACREIQNFLPLYETVSRWRDRCVRLQVPLFAGYVFVRLPLWERIQVLQIPGVVRLVGFGGLPTALPDQEIEALRIGLQKQLRLEPHPYLTIGRRVRVVRGSFQGAEGILVRKKGVFRVVLSLEAIQRSVAVEVNAIDVEPAR